ncbi:MAG: prolipoprotein diacylglyceryl transferase family protein, partial [Gemmatimonadota bacterium]
KPTDLPWGLEISPENRPIEFIDREEFHPTFAYEALWCFGAALLLLVIERRFRIRPGGLFALYVLVYSLGRVWIESLRVDPSHELAGVRLNVWVAGVAVVLAGAFFVWWQRRWNRGRPSAPAPKPKTMAVPRDR